MKTGGFRGLAISVLGFVWLMNSAAVADWRKDLGTFRIGLSASDSNALSPAELDQFRRGYAGALGMPVEVVILRDYPALIDAHASGRIEYALYSASAYATAHLLCQCLEPISAPVQTSGAIGIRSVLVMNANATFTRMDLNGIRVGIPGRDSFSGYAIPMTEYRVGSTALDAADPFLKEYAGMDEMLNEFVNGKLDGFFGWGNSDAGGLVESEGLMNLGAAKSITFRGITGEVKIPWTSALHRFGPHAVRRDLPSDVKRALVQYLLDLDAPMIDLISGFPPGDVARLIRVSHSDYLPAIRTAMSLANQLN